MIFALSGPVHSGKTTLLRNILSELKKMEFSIDGFWCQSILGKNKINGYNLVDVKEEIPSPFITKNGNQAWQQIGPFYFIPQGLDRAKEILLRGKDSDLLIVDEFGPLELDQKGLWPVLGPLLHQLDRNILLVIRENIIEDFLNQIGGERQVKIFNNRQKDIFPEIIRCIKKNVIK